MKEEQFVTLTLPAPISTNALWTVGRVRKKGGGFAHRLMPSKAYIAWKLEAGHAINQQNPGFVSGHYAMTIMVQDGLKIDLGNVEKAVSDLLQQMSVIENDRFARRINLGWSDKVTGMQVCVVKSKGAVNG